MSVSVIPPTGHLAFVATLSAFPECGAPFQLYASSTGTLPFSRIGDATFSGSCAAGSQRALTTSSVHGVPRVGRTLTATAPTWSTTPTSVAYQWQLCTAKGCIPIKSATHLTLRLTKRTAGHTVRIASVATFDSRHVESVSKRIAVRAANAANKVRPRFLARPRRVRASRRGAEPTTRCCRDTRRSRSSSV
jgi:hypothetical protein